MSAVTQTVPAWVEIKALKVSRPIDTEEDGNVPGESESWPPAWPMCPGANSTGNSARRIQGRSIRCIDRQLGFHQAVATDLAGAIALTNELRAALVEKGLIKGGS